MTSAFNKNVLVSAIVLGVFGVVGTSIVATTNWLTYERIEANEIASRLRQINEILPSRFYDNDLINDIHMIPVDTLSEGYPVIVYRARLSGEDSALIMQTIAPNGYAGPIKLLVAVLKDGTVSGVRVLTHKETPGLGDKIELRKNDWILGFAGKSLQNPSRERWGVKKDGGEFDQFTGATISPRIVTQAVRDSLLYFQEHRDAMFSSGLNPDSTIAVPPVTGKDS